MKYEWELWQNPSLENDIVLDSGKVNARTLSGALYRARAQAGLKREEPDAVRTFEKLGTACASWESGTMLRVVREDERGPN